MIEPYYSEDGITLYNARCEDVLPQLEEKSVAAVITDPPYGIGFGEYDEHRDEAHGYNEWIWQQCTAMEAKVSDGWMCVFQTAKKAREWAIMFPREWRLVACPKTFVQIYPVTGMTWATDYALVWQIGKPKQRGKGRDWKVSDTANMRFDRRHPCARPLTQIAYLVDCLSEAGDTLLDPFAGSGTLLLAAKRLGRRAIGIEMSEAYCKIAVQRLSQKELFGVESGHGT